MVPPRRLERIRAGHGRLARFAERVRRLDVDRDVATAAKVGARIVAGDAEWPERLDDLGVPPWCLWLRGRADLAEVTRRSVAIVGSRLCTAYGEQLAAELAAGRPAGAGRWCRGRPSASTVQRIEERSRSMG